VFTIFIKPSDAKHDSNQNYNAGKPHLEELKCAFWDSAPIKI
jgi:hypothetical protein